MAESHIKFRQLALANVLRGCPLFAGLPANDLEKLTEITVARSLEPSEYLFREGEPSEGFYVVQRGAINVHRVNAAGKEQVIHVFRAGQSFAEASLASEGGYPAHARALQPSQVLLVRKPDFLALLGRQPELALRMLSSLSLRLRTLVGQLEDLTLKDVESRLAKWMIDRCPDPASDKPVTIELTITKRALAAELGTVSETLSRTLAKLRAEKILIVQGRAITILSPAALSALLRRNLAG